MFRHSSLVLLVGRACQTHLSTFLVPSKSASLSKTAECFVSYLSLHFCLSLFRVVKAFCVQFIITVIEGLWEKTLQETILEIILFQHTFPSCSTVCFLVGGLPNAQGNPLVELSLVIFITKYEDRAGCVVGCYLQSSD